MHNVIIAGVLHVRVQYTRRRTRLRRISRRTKRDPLSRDRRKHLYYNIIDTHTRLCDINTMDRVTRVLSILLLLL